MIGGTAVETPAGAAHDDDDTQLVMAVQGGDATASAEFLFKHQDKVSRKLLAEIWVAKSQR